MLKSQKFTAALVVSLMFFIIPELAGQTKFYVSPESGAKPGKGTLKDPFTSISRAMKAVEKANKNMTADIIVYLRGGTYYLSSPLEFNENASGTNGFKVIYRAYENEVPVISGGQTVTGWTRVEGNIYRTGLKRDHKLRSLYVNGIRMRMAGSEKPIRGLGKWGEFAVNGTEPWALGAGTAIDGIKFSASELDLLKNPEDIELVQSHTWTEKILCARDIIKSGETMVVKLQQPYGAILTSMAWAGAILFENNFFIRNAYEFLDEPGEFYFDRQEQMLYYFSQGEDMEKAEAIAPATAGLIRIKGTSTDSRVQNISFEGITFAFDDWDLMDIDGSHGFGGIQSLGLAVKYIPDGNWHPTRYNSIDVPAGTVDLKNCSNIEFARNHFMHIGSATAVNLVNDVVKSEVTGNTFYDMAGNAINIGHPQHYIIGDGDIYPEGVEGVCRKIKVTNNYIRSASIDFRQLEAITSFFVESVSIDHNDISGTPYGAIACGWWWGNAGIPPSTVAKNNSICYNKAGDTHQALDDGGIIYVLGEQPGSMISHNYLFHGPRCIYPDDGSAYWMITENTILNSGYRLWLHIWNSRCHDLIASNNYVRDNVFMDNGTNDVVANTYNFRTAEFSGTAVEIMEAAGLEEAYKDIIPGTEWPKVTIYPSFVRDDM